MWNGRPYIFLGTPAVSRLQEHLQLLSTEVPKATDSSYNNRFIQSDSNSEERYQNCIAYGPMEILMNIVVVGTLHVSLNFILKREV